MSDRATKDAFTLSPCCPRHLSFSVRVCVCVCVSVVLLLVFCPSCFFFVLCFVSLHLLSHPPFAPNHPQQTHVHNHSLIMSMFESAAADIVPPSTGEIMTRSGQEVQVLFPWELNYTDYVRRIIAITQDIFKPTYSLLVESHGVSRVQRSGTAVNDAELDPYYLMKHVKQFKDLYAGELGQSTLYFEKVVGHILDARNKLAHLTLENSFTRRDVEKAFSYTARLAAGSRVKHVQENIFRLEQQFEQHMRSQQDRAKHARLPFDDEVGAAEIVDANASVSSLTSKLEQTGLFDSDDEFDITTTTSHKNSNFNSTSIESKNSKQRTSENATNKVNGDIFASDAEIDAEDEDEDEEDDDGSTEAETTDDEDDEDDEEDDDAETTDDDDTGDDDEALENLKAVRGIVTVLRKESGNSAKLMIRSTKSDGQALGKLLGKKGIRTRRVDHRNCLHMCDEDEVPDRLRTLAALSILERSKLKERKGARDKNAKDGLADDEADVLSALVSLLYKEGGSMHASQARVELNRDHAEQAAAVCKRHRSFRKFVDYAAKKRHLVDFVEDDGSGELVVVVSADEELVLAETLTFLFTHKKHQAPIEVVEDHLQRTCRRVLSRVLRNHKRSLETFLDDLSVRGISVEREKQRGFFRTATKTIVSVSFWDDEQECLDDLVDVLTRAGGVLRCSEVETLLAQRSNARSHATVIRRHNGIANVCRLAMSCGVEMLAPEDKEGGAKGSCAGAMAAGDPIVTFHFSEEEEQLVRAVKRCLAGRTDKMMGIGALASAMAKVNGHARELEQQRGGKFRKFLHRCQHRGIQDIMGCATLRMGEEDYALLDNIRAELQQREGSASTADLLTALRAANQLPAAFRFRHRSLAAFLEVMPNCGLRFRPFTSHGDEGTVSIDFNADAEALLREVASNVSKLGGVASLHEAVAGVPRHVVDAGTRAFGSLKTLLSMCGRRGLEYSEGKDTVSIALGPDEEALVGAMKEELIERQGTANCVVLARAILESSPALRSVMEKHGNFSTFCRLVQLRGFSVTQDVPSSEPPTPASSSRERFAQQSQPDFTARRRTKSFRWLEAPRSDDDDDDEEEAGNEGGEGGRGGRDNARGMGGGNGDEDDDEDVVLGSLQDHVTLCFVDEEDKVLAARLVRRLQRVGGDAPVGALRRFLLRACPGAKRILTDKYKDVQTFCFFARAHNVEVYVDELDGTFVALA